MPAHLYRDAHVGIRARLGELEAQVRNREAALTKAFWTQLEPYVQERLAELRAGRDLVASESLQELARAEGLLSAYVEELDRWIARAPALEEAWLEVPDDVDDPPPMTEEGAAPALGASMDRGEVMRALRAAVRGTADRFELIEEGARSFVARFRRRNVPFALRTTVLRGRRSGELGEVAMQLVTSVARATPPLLVKHESLFASVTKALGLVREVEVGDTSFDGLFLIQGAREDARQLLGPRVRGFLLELARFDVPTLEIDPARRTASLSWRFEPAASAIEAAARALSMIREVPAKIAFRR